MKTRICELFEIEYPIICGGILWLATPELCAAISNSGGLGNITACNYDTPEELRDAIQKARVLTSKPIGVNITLLPSMRFTEEVFDQFFKVCAEERVNVIEVSGRPAVKYLDMLHKAGVKVMHKVGAVRHALNIERFGYDAVIAAGIEEGGHPLNDDVTTMVLVPRIAESVKIPVIAAGGIADGRGLAAALALGAEGVLMATRFIATTECQVHPKIWEEIIKRQENDTTLICKSVGIQGRALKNSLTDRILELEKNNTKLEDILPLLAGGRAKQTWKTGEDIDNVALMFGQSIGLIKEVVSCETLIKTMVKEAQQILNERLKCFS
ncbi:MAG: NAD(P)H-dependent flavin oxidoreductase [Syntrophomonadaceae bacterium]